jgi:uncharacterized protein YigA (DUF484 family)
MKPQIQPRQRAPKELSAEAVANYLQSHPEFFLQHEELLAKLEIPHANGNTISLVERKLVVLREENQHLRQQLKELIANAQHNQQLNQRIQSLIVALSETIDLDEFFHKLYNQLNHKFKNDAVVILWFELAGTIARPEFVEYDAQIFALFETILEKHQPLCGKLTQEQLEYLFPNKYKKIASAILIPLGTPKPRGLLAMGSYDEKRFHPDMGTELLQYLGDLISHLLNMWIRHSQ